MKPSTGSRHTARHSWIEAVLEGPRPAKTNNALTIILNVFLTLTDEKIFLLFHAHDLCNHRHNNNSPYVYKPDFAACVHFCPGRKLGPV